MANLTGSMESQQVTIVIGVVTIVADVVAMDSVVESATSTLVSFSPAYEDTHTRKVKSEKKKIFISLRTPIGFVGETFDHLGYYSTSF